MKKRICQMAALGSALLLAFSAPVQAAAVTANGTPAAVATNNVQNWMQIQERFSMTRE